MSAATPAASVQYGKQAAAKVFDKRSRDKRYRNVEVHLSEAELAALMAMAHEAGGRTPA